MTGKVWWVCPKPSCDWKEEATHPPDIEPRMSPYNGCPKCGGDTLALVKEVVETHH